jgi:autotransporter-associated beta strand protein
MKSRHGSSGRSVRTVALLAALAAAAAAFPDSAAGQVTWSGSPTSGAWNSGGNWAGGNAPNGTNQAIVFGNSTITTTTNTFATGTFAGISFLSGAPAYTLGGNAITLTGNVTNSSTNLQSIGLNFTTTAQRTTTLTAGGGNLLLSGSIGGSGGSFATAGTGTLTLTGTNTFTGGVSLANNTTIVAGSPSALGTASGTVTFSGNSGGMSLVAAADSSLNAYPLALGAGRTATIVSDRATPGAGITHAFGTLGLSTSTLNATAGGNVTSGTATVGLSAINLSAGAAGASTLNPTTAAITVGAINVSGNPNPSVKTIVLGGTHAGNSVTGSISDNLSPVGVQKTGASIWVLSGSNSYGGGTTVNGGTLRVTNNAGLPAVNVNRIRDTAVAIAVSGSTAATTVDLSGVSVTGQIALSGSTNGAWLINDTPTSSTIGDGLAGIQFTNGGTGFTVANLNQAGVITLSGGDAAARITSLGGSLDTLTLVTGGTGWVVGNRITLSGGLGNTNLIPTQNAAYAVSSVGANGVITGLAVENPGMGYVSTPTGFTGGRGLAGPAFTGTGASFTFNNNFAAAQIQTTAIGSGYTVAPTVGTTTGSGLVATAVLSGVTLTGTTNSIGGAGNLTINSVVAGAGGGFSKVGGGRLTLSASNSYTGATRISEGILEIGSTGRINTTSGITIEGTTAEFKYNAAAALTRPITFTQGTISGTGTIATAVTVGTSDVISPGNSPGTQAYTSLHTWSPGGTYRWELNSLTGSPSVNWDLVNVTSGTFSLAGLSATPGNQFVIDLFTLGAGDVAGQLVNPYDGGSYTFAIASYAPANFLLPGGLSNIAGTDLTSLFTINLGNWQGAKPQLADVSVKINSTATGIDLVIVPEPQALALAGIGIAAAWAYRRRRSTP